MKRSAMFFAVLPALMTLSCTQDGHSPGPDNVPENALAAFNEMYPDASDVVWDARDPYWVASFEGGTDAVKSREDRNSAWYDSEGEWYMTEMSGAGSRLPEAVQDAFAASEYSSWRIDDVDLLHRYGMETVYVIEVEGEKDGVRMEVDLYYTEDGVLVKEVVDAEDGYDYRDYIPSRPDSGIEDFIASKYPGARIVDIEREDGWTEVEIVDGRVFREVYFDRSGAWTATRTEVHYGNLPEKVRETLSDRYAGYRVDDIDFYETASGSEFYRVELESREGDIEVNIDADGNVSENSPDYGPGVPGSGDGGHSGGPYADAGTFISEKYPGAVILEFDHDDGYLQVEIRHDGREKEVYFNGRMEWVRTEWDVRYHELPESVKAVLETDYAEFHADDLTFVETPDVSYYFVELEDRHDREINLRITPDGTVL